MLALPFFISIVLLLLLLAVLVDVAEDGEDASTSRPTKYEARWAGKMEYPETMLLVVNNNNMLARATKWNVEERVIIYLGSISKAAGMYLPSSSSDD
jgi:hypothetical protein